MAPEQDFTTESLAVYLHLLPNQITKLANRGRIPGRKVAGQWRFSRAEIHHWMEQRMGLLDQDELLQMESVLQRADSGLGQTDTLIAELLQPACIAIPLEARTRSSVIESMTELAAATGLLWDSERMMEAIRNRENMQPTALDNGVALLHPRRPMPSVLGGGLLAMGCTPTGIPFGNSRGLLTDIFFLICSTDDQSHLRTLARLSRILADTDLLENIRQATDSPTVYNLLTNRERELLD